jgi:hypothetical protein
MRIAWRLLPPGPKASWSMMTFRLASVARLVAVSINVAIPNAMMGFGDIDRGLLSKAYATGQDKFIQVICKLLALVIQIRHFLYSDN